MKNFTKNCLIAAGILFIVGFAICFITYSIGGPALTSNLLSKNWSYQFNIPGTDHINKMVLNSNVDINSSGNFNSNYPVYDSERTDDQAALKKDVTDFVLNIGGGQCIIEDSNDDYFHISYKGNGHIQYYVEDNTFYLNGFYDSNEHQGNYHDKVTLQIPKDMVFQDVAMDIGAIDLTVDTLHCDTINMNIGAGSADFDTLEANDATFDIGAGSTKVNKGTISDANFDIGMGSIHYSGLITGDLDASCGMGSIDLALKDSEKDHNYDMSCSMGTIELNGHQYSGFEYDQTIDNQSNSNYSLDCAMGSIKVKYE